MACALQRQYGKSEKELEMLVEGFSWSLSDYPMDTILIALRRHLKASNQIPTPADIEEIINPKPKQLSAAMYVALKKRAVSGEYLYGSDLEYIHAFEGQEKSKVRGGTLELRDAIAEVERFKVEYGGAA